MTASLERRGFVCCMLHRCSGFFIGISGSVIHERKPVRLLLFICRILSSLTIQKQQKDTMKKMLTNMKLSKNR